MDRPFLGMLTQSIGRSNYLTCSHAPACQQGTADLWPVVAAPVFVDDRCPTEFAPDDDRDILVQSAVVQIVQQCRQTLIQHRKMISCIFKVGPVRPTVPVPSSVGKSHDAGPGFNQSSGCQQVIVHQRACIAIPGIFGGTATVTITDSWIFLFQIESIDKLAGGQDSKRGLIL